MCFAYSQRTSKKELEALGWKEVVKEPYTGTGAWYQDAVHLEDLLKPKLPRIPILY